MQTATKGNTTWTYTYNADGLRIGKTNGTTTYTYTWNDGKLTSQTWGNSYMLFYYNAEGKPLYMEYADGNDECSGTYRYILNLQGDVVGLYDLTRDCMAMTYTYDAWGRELSWSTLNSGYAGLLYGNPLTYRGYIYDRETGFYYLQSRYYDPTIGRFLNADDIQYLGASGSLLSLNLFVYCENNVVNYYDYDGRTQEKAFWRALGFVYDGSYRDFRRLECGLPPLSYEMWLRNGGTIKFKNAVFYNNYGVTKSLKSLTYVPKKKTTDYYISQLEGIVKQPDQIGIISVGLSGISLFKSSPIFALFSISISVLSVLSPMASAYDLERFEKKMRLGEGVIIVEWCMDGSRCGHSTIVEYISWNGKGNPLEKKYIF